MRRCNMFVFKDFFLVEKVPAMLEELSLPVSMESDAQKLLHSIFFATDIRTNRANL